MEKDTCGKEEKDTCGKEDVTVVEEKKEKRNSLSCVLNSSKYRACFRWSRILFYFGWEK
jgi:hypothetical protein